MKNSLFVLFWCDLHHTHDSKRIAGIFEDFDKAFDGAIKFSKSSEEGRLSVDDKLLLKRINQTQGRNENYIIEEWEINKLIKQI